MLVLSRDARRTVAIFNDVLTHTSSLRGLRRSVHGHQNRATPAEPTDALSGCLKSLGLFVGRSHIVHPVANANLHWSPASERWIFLFCLALLAADHHTSCGFSTFGRPSPSARITPSLASVILTRGFLSIFFSLIACSTASS